MNLQEAIRARLIERHGELAIRVGEQLMQLKDFGVYVSNGRKHWSISRDPNDDTAEIGTVFIDGHTVRWHLWANMHDCHHSARSVEEFIARFTTDLEEQGMI